MNYMITEKGERILKRTIGWLQMWKYSLDTKEPEIVIQGLSDLADEQLAKLEEQWQINEALNGRR